MRQLALTALPLLLLLTGCGSSSNDPSTSAEPTKAAVLFTYSAAPGSEDTKSGELRTLDQNNKPLDSLPFRGESGDTTNIPLTSIVKLTLTDPRREGLWCNPATSAVEDAAGVIPPSNKVSNAEVITEDGKTVKGCVSPEYNTVFLESGKNDPAVLTIYDPELLRFDDNYKYHVRKAVGTISKK